MDTSHTSMSSQHNGGLNLTRDRTRDETLPRGETRGKQANVSNFMLLTTEAGVKEMIQSLGLLSLVSLLLALGKKTSHLETNSKKINFRITCFLIKNSPLSAGGWK